MERIPLRGILFDRDGTLVRDVLYNRDPDAVELMPGAAWAVAQLRRAGLKAGVATNQPGIATGRLSSEDLWLVNDRIDRLAGPFDAWHVCPHAPEAGCECRKPRPGMILAAAEEWGVRPAELAFIGDTGADVLAALAAGARSVLVPTPTTKPEEVLSAPSVAATIAEAVQSLLAHSVPEPA